jgi:DNA-binding response OmpR family regulator
MARLLYAAEGRIDRRLIKAFRELNHRVDVAAEWEDCAAIAGQGPYDAILIDTPLASPDRVRRLAGLRPEAFVIALVDRAGEDERVATLRAGADACFARPLHVGEIAGRLESHSRRSRPSQESGPGAVRLEAGQVAVVNGRRVQLTRGEYALAELFVRQPGEVLSAERLAFAVWGADRDHDWAGIRTRVSRLRAKIEPIAGRRLISTHPGAGYAYVGAAERDTASEEGSGNSGRAAPFSLSPREVRR